MEVNNECEPSYCGIEEYNEWFARHSARLELLEELKHEINAISE